MTVPVAVVIPAFSAGGELTQTVESVLAQTVSPAEICVTVDAASTDDTLAVARRFEPAVTVVPIEPTTAMRGRQLAVDATSAPLVAPCDADDLWVPAKLERQVDALDADAHLDGVFCDVSEFVTESEPGAGPGLRRPHGRLPGRVASALLVRRSALRRVGGFVADDHVAQWIAWLSSALSAGLRLGSVDEVLVHRRLRAEGYTSRHRDQTGEILDTVRDHLQRRRGPSDTPERPE